MIIKYMKLKQCGRNLVDGEIYKIDAVIICLFLLKTSVPAKLK